MRVLFHRLTILNFLTPSLPHSLLHSLPHSLPYLLPPSLPHSLTHSLTPSLTPSLTHSPPQVKVSPRGRVRGLMWWSSWAPNYSVSIFRNHPSINSGSLAICSYSYSNFHITFTLTLRPPVFRTNTTLYSTVLPPSLPPFSELF